MGVVTITQMADRVEGLLVERLGARGRDFPAKLRHSGRKLPRKVRRAAEALAQSAEMARNPKFLARVDEELVAQNYDICLRHLSRQKWRGSGASLSSKIAASVGLVLVIGAAVAWAYHSAPPS